MVSSVFFGVVLLLGANVNVAVAVVVEVEVDGVLSVGFFVEDSLSVDLSLSFSSVDVSVLVVLAKPENPVLLLLEAAESDPNPLAVPKESVGGLLLLLDLTVPKPFPLFVETAPNPENPAVDPKMAEGFSDDDDDEDDSFVVVVFAWRATEAKGLLVFFLEKSRDPSCLRATLTIFRFWSVSRSALGTSVKTLTSSLSSSSTGASSLVI